MSRGWSDSVTRLKQISSAAGQHGDSKEERSRKAAQRIGPSVLGSRFRNAGRSHRPSCRRNHADDQFSLARLGC
jgi:hypothetical protein